MIDRIRKILTEKRLSASKFADEIGVQRSGISHIISGRNKPSLEFIQKVLERFPEINPEWLLSGSGKMRKDDTGAKNVVDSGLFADVTEKKAQSVESHPPAEYKTLQKPKKAGKVIERIIVLYNDGTFTEFRQED